MDIADAHSGNRPCTERDARQRCSGRPVTRGHDLRVTQPIDAQHLPYPYSHRLADSHTSAAIQPIAIGCGVWR
jgi:hypothetical protein